MRFVFRRLKLNKKLRRAFVLFVVLFLGIGFAYIQSDLNINTLLTAIKGKWQLDYTNFEADTNSTATDDSYNYNNETNKITFTAPLNSLSDYYSFSFDIENNGTIEAKLNSLTLSGLSEEEQEYVDYTVTYIDNATPKAGDGIEVDTIEHFQVTVKYKDTSSVTSGTYNLSLHLDYGKSDGYITRRKTLYKVLEQEATKGTFARKYTGEHQDSMDSSLSTKNIYHWYADNDSDGTKVTNMNNVIFANHCWQMIRTTDTGGVRLLYNGEQENGKCLDNRSKHVGYMSTNTTLINGEYWYSDDYEYDKDNNEFYLVGDLIQSAWNATTRPGLVGKYTCKSTDSEGRCSSLYMIMEGVSSINSNYSNITEIKKYANYHILGSVQFNESFSSPAYSGYMYGEPYDIDYKKILVTDNLTQELLTKQTINTTYWYADSYTYSNGYYTLNNPYQVSSEDDFPSLVGKYTQYRTTANSSTGSITYIAGVNGTAIYKKSLSNGEIISDLKIGNSITYNNDGTYTINNITNVSLIDWNANYENYNNKYICNDGSSICSNPSYIVEPALMNYKYINAGENILISKNRNGLNLSDTTTIRKDQLIINWEDYGDYKYTCNNTSSTCSEDELRFIESINETSLKYVSNRYFGSSVTWDGTQYTLVDPIGVESYNNLESLSSHHFTCISDGQKSCTSVAYINYFYPGTSFYYITLENGVTSITDILNNMFTQNTKDSSIKTVIEAWYKKNILTHDSYVDDTIYCNERTVSSYGGWNPSGGIANESLKFKNSVLTGDLSCNNVTDRFSVSNSEAKLNYKVGLPTASELYLLNNPIIRKVGIDYWTNSPSDSSTNNIWHNTVTNNGIFTTTLSTVNYTHSLRPELSLKNSVKSASGDGSKEYPFNVDAGMPDG